MYIITGPVCALRDTPVDIVKGIVFKKYFFIQIKNILMSFVLPLVVHQSTHHPSNIENIETN